MNGPGTAREALLAEALGDLARLLDRAEALQPAVAESCQLLLEAHAMLADRMDAFESQVATFTERAKQETVSDVAARIEEAARRLKELQILAMSQAARQLFQAEVGPALQKCAAPLRQLAERESRRWDRWMMHVATAVASSIITWAMTVWLLTR